jgi:beta-lactamase class A
LRVEVTLISITGIEAMKKILPICCLISSLSFSQSVRVPDYLVIDTLLNARLHEIVADLGLEKDFDVGEDGIEQISLAVIDLTSKEPHLGGVHSDNFIYPASVYKMYVAAEVLEQVSLGKYSLWRRYVVKSPNDVDRSKELEHDPRPLLRDGDTVTVNYLLDLMITRSDNTAANCLIDMAGRQDINALLERYNWLGSEVTRKFLSRRFEDPGYEKIRGTETCALHAADFMYRVYTDQLVNPWVSQQMKSYLARQLDTTKLAAGLPSTAVFYHKTGWYSYWTNDVGIVDDGMIRYVIACFLPLREEFALAKLKEVSRRVYELFRGKTSGN